MAYEELMSEYPHLIIKEVEDMPKGLAGLNIDNLILIDKYRCAYEKQGILAEELGHYETTYGDISDLSKLRNWKLELVARRWGYEKVVSLERLVACYELGYRTSEEICLHLEVTGKYLQDSIDHYHSLHGIFIEFRNYRIYFDPLHIRRR